MTQNLKQHVINEFSGDNAQRLYLEKALNGLWISEDHFIEKYFTNENAKLLDVGCGTGRTTIPFFQQGYEVIGIDLVPKMIENAKEIAKKFELDIDYRIGDATSLDFEDGTFDYALFSNQGWTQIPGRENRRIALTEIKRVLKQDGVFIFSAHRRRLFGENFFFWIWQWIRVNILKFFGFNIPEVDFGDRFFDRESYESDVIYKSKQFIHIPSVEEVKEDIISVGFEILEVNGELQVSEDDIKEFPPVFYICKKTSSSMNAKFNELTEEEEKVIIHKATEAPFSGEYNTFKEAGTYLCRGCNTPLYKSDAKFDSNCGWPSFDDELPNSVKRVQDGNRTEIVCINCEAHLGHVFEGERFTKKNTRHCVNSISLKFVTKEG